MIRRLGLILCLLMCSVVLHARGPLYVVNGRVVESIDHIPHEDIRSIDVLPANEQTIATWGAAASEGVILVTLCYDTPAQFAAEGIANFTDYLATKVDWGDNMPAERVSLRIAVDEEGRATVSEVLEATSRQYLKRVVRAIEASPLWRPAMLDGEAVATLHLVNLTLPAGKSLPREQVVIVL